MKQIGIYVTGIHQNLIKLPQQIETQEKAVHILWNVLKLAWWRHQMEKNRHYWPFVRGIHRSPVNSPYKGQWRGTLMFSLIWAWINGWVNNREADDLIRHHAHYDVIIMRFEYCPEWHSLSQTATYQSFNGCQNTACGLHIKGSVKANYIKFNVVHVCVKNQYKWAQTPLLRSRNWKPRPC